MALTGKDEDSRLVGMVDRGSTGSPAEATACVRSSSVANLAKLSVAPESEACTCTCRKTCTPTGCTPTTECTKLDLVKLATCSSQVYTRDTTLCATEALGPEVGVVLGCSEARKCSLADHFKHVTDSPFDTKDERETAVS